MIQTVLAKIDNNSVYHAQCHEHLFIAKGKSFEVNPMLCIDDVDKTIEELKVYKINGGSLIVDAQPFGCGRMEAELTIASRLSAIHVVASTGFHKLVFYGEDHWIHKVTTDEFAKLLISEITEGMYVNSDKQYPSKQVISKAGMIKIAVDEIGLTAEVTKLFDGAIKAALYTGAPIQCHIEKANQGVVIGNYLINNGIAKEQIILAHLDRDVTKHDDILAVAALGVYMQFDTIGRFKYHSDEAEVNLIKSLIKDGYKDQLIIGLDTTRARLKSYNGDIGLDYILNAFIPHMLQKGVSMEHINEMTIINPRKALNMQC